MPAQPLGASMTRPGLSVPDHKGSQQTRERHSSATASDVQRHRGLQTRPDQNPPVPVNNAGVQRRLELAPGTLLDEEGLRDEINTNVLGVIRVAAEFIPHLTQQSNAVLVNVSSGLAFVPLARFPVYCAAKAAVHSFTLSLRHQLKGAGVKVIELIPPYVATELGGPRKTVGPGGPQPMPLPAFIAEIDLLIYRKDTQKIELRQRLDQNDAYFSMVRNRWSQALVDAYQHLPRPDWKN